MSSDNNYVSSSSKFLLKVISHRVEKNPITVNYSVMVCVIIMPLFLHGIPDGFERPKYLIFDFKKKL
jgi:hypothetical protein